jgi:APA family basic amino acid/polyamine antiporter
MVGIVAVIVLSAINYRGVKPGSVVQTTLTITKTAAVVVFTAIAFSVGPHKPVVAESFHGDMIEGALIRAVIAGLFAFGGWHMVTFAAEETVDPERTLPRALILGVAIVTACYLALNAAYFHVLAPSLIARSTRVAADAAEATLGTRGAAFVSAVVALSALGALNGIILAGPRVYLAMARDGLAPKWIGEIHPTFATPSRAIAAQMIWAVVLVSTGTYRALFTRVVYTEWIFFALMAFGLMRLRKRADYAPRFRLRARRLIPMTFIGASALIVLFRIVSQPLDSLSGLALVAIGWPVYHFTLRQRLQPT